MLGDATDTDNVYPGRMREELTVAEHIGRNVHDLRRAAGVTQGDLADAMAEIGLGWHRGLVADVETGGRELTVSELAAVAAYFEVPVVMLASELGASNITHDIAVGDRRLSSISWMQLWREQRDQNSPAGPLSRKAIDAIVGSLYRPWARIWRKRGGHAATAYAEAWEEIIAKRPAIGPTFVPTSEPVGVGGSRGPWRERFSFELELGEPYAARDDVERDELEKLKREGKVRRITPQQAYKLRRKRRKG